MMKRPCAAFSVFGRAVPLFRWVGEHLDAGVLGEIVCADDYSAPRDAIATHAVEVVEHLLRSPV